MVLVAVVRAKKAESVDKTKHLNKGVICSYA